MEAPGAPEIHASSNMADLWPPSAELVALLLHRFSVLLSFDPFRHALPRSLLAAGLRGMLCLRRAHTPCAPCPAAPQHRPHQTPPWARRALRMPQASAGRVLLTAVLDQAKNLDPCKPSMAPSLFTLLANERWQPMCFVLFFSMPHHCPIRCPQVCQLIGISPLVPGTQRDAALIPICTLDILHT
eukprot:1160084-Pelagomonas_calceolata.AAC.2